MDNGSIIANGNYADITNNFPQYRKFDGADEVNLSQIDVLVDSNDDMETLYSDSNKLSEDVYFFKQNLSKILMKRQQSSKLMVEEDREKGLYETIAQITNS
jgi:hypothetical protein